MRFNRILLALTFSGLIFFGYLFWHTSTSPDTLSDMRDFSPTLGTKVIEDLSALPTLPIQEEQDHFKIEDSIPDGIQIQYANQGETETPSPKQTVTFPKDPKRPIEVRLDQERVIPIQDQSTEDYTLDTLTREKKDIPFYQALFQQDNSPREYLRYEGDRKTLLYAYEKDQATGEKKLKHWTLYESGTGLEEEKYQLNNVKLKINENGDAEIFYFGEKQIQNEAVKAEVAPSLLERAQKTLEKDLGNDILSGQTPDFIIPRPYYLNSQGEKRDLDWKWDEEKRTLSVSFSPESYPVALDPTLQFTAPGQSNTGSVISGEASGHEFGWSLATGDFNSDGRKDLAVGAKSYSATLLGRVYIFYNDGNFTSIAAGADAIITGDAATDLFGLSMAAGDFNADGRTDLAVGSFHNAAYIFYSDGAYPSLASSADVTIAGETSSEFGNDMIAGDLNSDGRTDLIVGAYAYSSSTGRSYVFYNDGSIPTAAASADIIITGESSSQFGQSFSVGDFNSDGKVDLAVGANFYSTSTGRTYIFYGDGSIPTTAATADVTITGETTSNAFGNVLTAGDFNADGRTDLAVSSTGYAGSTGRVYIFYNDGSIPTTAGTADVIVTGSGSPGYFGTSLIAGDMNGDGRADLLVGASDFSNGSGGGYILYNDGSLPTTASTADVIIRGENNSQLGGAIVVSDFNADGKVDFVISGTVYASSTGRAYIFYSQNGQVNTNQSITGAGAHLDEFGNALAVGDLNADGRADLAVGAWKYDSSDTGRVYIFYGDGQIPTSATSADVTIGSGGGTSDYFGRSLAVGDFNADGETDLAVGADGYSTNTGRVYIFYNDGSYPGNATTADVTITGESTSNYFGYALSAADLNFDGETDLVASAYGYSTNTGRVYIFHNDGSYTSAAGSADVVITGSASSYLGGSLATGDLNADSRIDLVVTERNTGGGWVYARGFYNDGSIPTSSGSADFTLSQGYTSAGSAIATGDFNADGRTDIAWGVYPSNATYILYNDGSYPSGNVQDGFADVVITGSGSFGSALIAGDFNADSRTDLAIGANTLTTNTGAVYFFYNDGSLPTTSATADVTITGETTSNYFGAALAAGDMNGDGRTDLVVGANGNSSSNGKVYFYETRENFAWEIQQQARSAPRTNLNGAGQELKITGEANSQFGATFTKGDFNLDGKADLIVGAPSYSSNVGRVYVFYSDGSLATGAPSADLVFTGGTSSQFGSALTVGDFNADGRDDLVVGAPAVGSGNGAAYIFYNDGIWPATSATADVSIAGEFSSAFGNALVAGDFNTDGETDIAIAGYYYSGTYTGRVYIFHNDGSYTSAAGSADVIISGSTSNSSFGISLAAGDLNADGRTDLTIGQRGNTNGVYIYYNDGSIPTTEATADVTITGPGQFFATALVTGDFNFDGEIDLAVGSSEAAGAAVGKVYIFHNDGSYPATYSGADVTITGEATAAYFGAALTAGDFNTDGRTDLAVGGYFQSTLTGRTYIFYNDGSIPTAAGSADVILTGESTSSSYGYGLAAGDFNADGRIDLAVGAYTYSSSTGRVYIYTFNNDPIITGGAVGDRFGFSMTSGDFNSDGKIDLAVGAYYYSSQTGRVYVFYNDGAIPAAVANADITITGETASDWFGHTLAAGDVNADGRTDLLSGSFVGKLYLFYNDGSIPTTAATADVIISGGVGYPGITVGDLNTDGKMDILSSAFGYSSNGRAYLFYGDGTNNFGSATCTGSSPTSCSASNADIIVDGTGGKRLDKVAIGDMNADGRDDMVLTGTNSTDGAAYILYNDGSSFGTTACTTACSVSNADVMIAGETSSNFGSGLVLGDLNSDGKKDLIVGSAYSSSTGRVYIFYNDGSYPTDAASADSMITGTAINSYLGNTTDALAVADVNLDGRDDLIAGAYGDNGGAGRVYVFLNDGTYPSLVSSADMTYSGTSGSEYFGISVKVININNDGITDIAVGSYGYPGGGVTTGRVYFFSSEAAAANVSAEPARVRGTIKTRGTIKVR